MADKRAQEMMVETLKSTLQLLQVLVGRTVASRLVCMRLKCDGVDLLDAQYGELMATLDFVTPLA